MHPKAFFYARLEVSFLQTQCNLLNSCGLVLNQGTTSTWMKTFALDLKEFMAWWEMLIQKQTIIRQEC